MDERERLAGILRQVRWGATVEEVANALLTVMDIGQAAWWRAENGGATPVDRNRARYTAATAHLFRKLVAGLPGTPWKEEQVWVGRRWVWRADLAALAGPYDGGEK